MIVGCQPETRIFWQQTKPSLGPFEDFRVVEIVVIVICCASIDNFFRGSHVALLTTSQLALVWCVVHEKSTLG